MFAFQEADHLIRIHLKLALEDIGFTVREEGETVAIVPEDSARSRSFPASQDPQRESSPMPRGLARARRI